MKYRVPYDDSKSKYFFKELPLKEKEILLAVAKEFSEKLGFWWKKDVFGYLSRMGARRKRDWGDLVVYYMRYMQK